MSKALFVLHLPPPVHGAAMMGKYIHDSEIINNEFNCKYINLTLAKDLKDIGKGGLRKLIDFIKQLNNIRKTVKSFKPELCYVTPNAKGGAFYKDFVVIMLLKILGQKVVVHYHNKGVATRQEKFLDNLLYKCFFKNLKVILLAEQLYQDIKKYVSKENVYFCPNGIPVQSTPTVKKEHTGFNILFLSNMMKEKGVWDLVDACKLLKDKNKNFQCHFVGKWSDITEDAFNNRIKELGLADFIIAHGAKYGKEKIPYLESSDCFILPTHNECFPLVLLEAMEQGIACISTNEGGVRAIIDDGTTGFIVNKQNPTELAAKIEFMIEHSEECKSMGYAGKQKFEKEFTLFRFEKRMKDILKEILSQC